MKRLALLVLVTLTALGAQAQTSFPLNYDTVRVGKTTGTSGISLYGKVYLKNVTSGLGTDSILTVRNGKIFKISLPVPVGLSDSLANKANRNFNNVASGAIANSKLANSTISGVSLGSNLAALTAGNGVLSAGTYNGATARTFSVDTAVIRSVSNSVSLSGLQTRLNAYQALLSGTGIVKSTSGTISYLTDNSTNWNTAYAYSQVGHLPLTAGATKKLTNDLYLNYTNAAIVFQGSTTDGLIINNVSSLLLADNNTGTKGISVNLTSGALTQLGTGSFKSPSLAGIGTRMVVADNVGTLSTQAIPSGGGGGAITNIGVASSNGLAGTSDGDPNNPTLTLSTTVTGLLKGNGTAISAATAGSDYLTPTGSAASLTSFPTLNQNTSGNAATATLAANSTLWGSQAYSGASFITPTQILGFNGSFWGPVSDADLNTYLGGPFLPLTAGSSKKLTGDLYINKVNSAVIFQGNTTDGILYNTGSTMVLGDNNTGTKGLSVNLTTGGLSQLGAGAIALNGSISASNLTGTNTGDQTSVTGNAGTATALQTARTISGVSFDGTANITLNNTGITNGAGYITSSALSPYAPLASPTFTGTVSGVTASMVGAPSGSGTSTGTNTGDQTWTTLSGKPSFATVATSGAYSDLSGTPNLALKEDVSNKSTTTTLGTSNTLYPTQNAVKTYVDNQVASSVSGITSGEYTPTISSTTGLASTTPYVCYWQRIGDYVQVSGSVSVTTSASAVSRAFLMSLPIATTFSDVRQVRGVASNDYTTSPQTNIFASLTGIKDNAVLNMTLPVSATHEVSFTFTYKIIL